MSLDEWQAIGIVCGALLALGALLRVAGKALWKMFRLMRKASEFLDQVLGDKESNRPSMMEVLQDNRTRLEAIEVKMAEHIDQYHGGSNPAGPVPLRRPRR